MSTVMICRVWLGIWDKDGNMDGIRDPLGEAVGESNAKVAFEKATNETLTSSVKLSPATKARMLP